MKWSSPSRQPISWPNRRRRWAWHLLAIASPGRKLSGGLQWMELFASRGPLHVPRNDMSEFLRQVAALPVDPRFDLPQELHFEQVIGARAPA